MLAANAFYNPSNILPGVRLVQTRKVTENSTAKAEEYPNDIPQFSKLHKDIKHNSFHLTREFARIFVAGLYVCLKAHSFPRATLLENCSLGTDNVRGQIYEHISAPNGGRCLYINNAFRSGKPIS